MWPCASIRIQGKRCGGDTHCPDSPQCGTGGRILFRTDADSGGVGRASGTSAGILQNQGFQGFVLRPPLSFGYTNREKSDAEDILSAGQEWEYKLWVITVDYPAQYSRSLFLDLTESLTAEGDWCELADLNILRLSSVSAFGDAAKARVGKVCGIIDPVFGILDGYGAYFQNLYATRNVNIAGTLTAGDENGFSSTFYVGKIHKNVIQDSLSCAFSGSMAAGTATPTGIGKSVRVTSDSRLTLQDAGWRKARAGNYYCFPSG